MALTAYGAGCIVESGNASNRGGYQHQTQVNIGQRLGWKMDEPEERLDNLNQFSAARRI